MSWFEELPGLGFGGGWLALGDCFDFLEELGEGLPLEIFDF